MADCPTCGEERDSWQKLRLHHLSAHDESLPNRECSSCGNQFYSEWKRKYCSDDCRAAERDRPMAGANNPNYRGAKETTDCEQCGASFEYYPSEKAGKFCPDCVANGGWRTPPELTGEESPHYQGGKVSLTCDVCDRAFERYPSGVGEGATLCSNDCRATWLSEAFTGPGHPNWEGGSDAPYGQGWNAVRQAALERDEHECVFCGRGREDLGRNPDVHHIVPVRRFVESPVLGEADAHTLDNVVLLCSRCHRRAEFGAIPAGELRHLVTRQTLG